MRVLVVDDDPFMTEILKLYLVRAGYEAEAAENGLKALRLRESAPLDVVITDAVMPEMRPRMLLQAGPLPGASQGDPFPLQHRLPRGDAVMGEGKNIRNKSLESLMF